MRKGERYRWFEKWLHGEFTPPGYNFFGPGNKMDDFEPLNEVDQFGYEHDEEYGEIEKQTGLNEYWYYNWADARLLNRLKKRPEFAAKIAQNYFKFKKYMAEQGLGFGVSQVEREGVAPYVANPSLRGPPTEIEVDADGDFKTPERPRKRFRHSRIDPMEDKRRFDRAKIDARNKESDDMDTSDPNAKALVAVSARGMSNVPRSKGETPLDPWQNWRFLPFNDTQNAIMPYTQWGTLLLNAAGNQVGAFTYRLNSIRDIQTVPPSGPAVNPTLPLPNDTENTPVNLPQMWNYWSTIYRYWSVVKSEYSIHMWIENQASPQELSVWTYHHGAQGPPVLTSGINGIIPDYVREMHRHCHLTPLRSSNAAVNQNIYQTGTHIRGSYSPGNGSVHNEVAEDEVQQTWHRTNEVPPLKELVSFIVQRSDFQRSINPGTTQADDVNIKFEFKIKYHVQWKDLNAVYQYPDQTTTWSGYTTPAAYQN